MARDFEWRPARDSPRFRRLLIVWGLLAAAWGAYGVHLAMSGDGPLRAVVWVVLAILLGTGAALVARARFSIDAHRLTWRGPLRSGSVAWEELTDVTLSWRRGWTLRATTEGGDTIAVGSDALNGLEDAGDPKIRFLELLRGRADEHALALDVSNFPESGTDLRATSDDDPIL